MHTHTHTHINNTLVPFYLSSIHLPVPSSLLPPPPLFLLPLPSTSPLPYFHLFPPPPLFPLPLPSTSPLPSFHLSPPLLPPLPPPPPLLPSMSLMPFLISFLYWLLMRCHEYVNFTSSVTLFSASCCLYSSSQACKHIAVGQCALVTVGEGVGWKLVVLQVTERGRVWSSSCHRGTQLSNIAVR